MDRNIDLWICFWISRLDIELVFKTKISLDCRIIIELIYRITKLVSMFSSYKRLFKNFQLLK